MNSIDSKGITKHHVSRPQIWLFQVVKFSDEKLLEMYELPSWEGLKASFTWKKHRKLEFNWSVEDHVRWRAKNLFDSLSLLDITSMILLPGEMSLQGFWRSTWVQKCKNVLPDWAWGGSQWVTREVVQVNYSAAFCPECIELTLDFAQTR